MVCSSPYFIESHKKSLAKLEKTDPEFYKFLKENDKKLLEYSSSEEEEETKGFDDEGTVYKLPNLLYVDSEESDFEDDNKEKSKNQVTIAMVTKWRENLINDPSVGSISNAVEAFHAALDRVTGEDHSELKVDGSGVFNAIIEMCVLHLHKSINDFLKLNPTTMKHPEKAKKWIKIRSLVEGYFTDLLKLLAGVASENIISVLLKHLHSCCHIVIYFHKLSKMALKQLTKLWSTGEESVRVLAYLCVLRLCTLKKSTLLNTALKFLYIAYIRGSKFVSINTLAQINFMKRSLVDLFNLDPVLSYQHCFLYLRQLAIHLRNAVTLQKKESFQSVYNWQYIHSLRLWVDLMCETNSKELLQLVYPLVQVIIGVIKLIPTSQYIPLRFHCIKMLIKLVRETNTYIPVLHFITDSLSCADISKQYKNVSMKPFDFTFVLRVSKQAMTESGYPDAVVEYVYQLLLEYAATCSSSIGFPDLFIPVSVQLKSIIKNCRNSKYTTKLKQVLIKIEENSKFIINERSKLNINLNENDKIKAFQSDMKLKVPPLQKYWNQLQKINEMKKSRRRNESEKQEKGESYDKLPSISRDKLKRKNVKEGPVELLPSDESDFEFPQLTEDEPKEKRKKRVKKSSDRNQIKENGVNNIDVTETADDIYEDQLEDLNINEF
ncbi:nucleolar complex protein 2 isoform X2 [Halyomorpha halys]|uniref:nucleolar complex protein 2 isoform X2 n=1 Tax=Halyomorpha halys TaxID=286706 RepID=UPI0034D264F3